MLTLTVVTFLMLFFKPPHLTWPQAWLGFMDSTHPLNVAVKIMVAGMCILEPLLLAVSLLRSG